MHEVWDKYKEFLRMFPHHGVPRWMQIYNFYKGLTSNSRTLINASTRGAMMKKNENKAFELLEYMAFNNYLWPNERLPPLKKVARVHDIDVILKPSAQLTLLT